MEDGRSLRHPPGSDAAVMARLPGIRIDHDNIAYYRGLLDRRLLLDRCGACGAWNHPPRPSCPRCWSWQVAAEQVSGRGEVYMFSFLNALPAADGAPGTDSGSPASM